MARQNITAADHIGTVPVTAISCPSDNAPAMAADIQLLAATQLANDAAQTTAVNTKVAKAGDTMTGQLILNAGAKVASGQDLDLDGAAVVGVVGFAVLGRVRLGGRKQLWRARVTLADASQDVTVAQGDRFTCPAANAAPRTITLKSTGTVPEVGETLAFYWNPGTSGGGGTQYTFQRESGTVVATFVGAQVADTGAVFAEFEYTAGGWRLGSHSGTPNEYIGPTPGPESWNSYGVIPGAGA